MGYKKIGKGLRFVDIEVKDTLKHNRSLKMMDKINRVVNWKRIEAVLMEYYGVGKSKEGADAYSPLMLLKAMLLQKWFRIVSDPELENQINDRISFKKFLGLPLDKPSPDHSTFSRFRNRISEEGMREVNNAVLMEFARKGLKINEGIAVDARLVKSASKPISNEKIKEQRQKKAEKQAKDGKAVKFSRDIDSDWTIIDEKAHYGLKEHVSVDINNGFVLATKVTPASEHESKYLPYLAIASCHTEEPIKKIYADKGYFGQPNRAFLNLNDIEDGIMRKDTTKAKLTKFEIERNKQISKKRYIVEQYFGLTHLHDRAYRARFTEILKNLWDSMCRQMAFNIFRGMKILASA